LAWPTHLAIYLKQYYKLVFSNGQKIKKQCILYTLLVYILFLNYFYTSDCRDHSHLKNPRCQSSHGHLHSDNDSRSQFGQSLSYLCSSSYSSNHTLSRTLKNQLSHHHFFRFWVHQCVQNLWGVIEKAREKREITKWWIELWWLIFLLRR